MTTTAIRTRPAAERGVSDLGWLSSRHSFSFGSYVDPEQMGFRALRVINDDRVAPGRGFGTHPHADMEIVSVVVEGALEHRDSLGNGSTILPGEVQRMTAGTGILHSERNPSPDRPVRFLQIWIVPERRGLAPSYEQRAFPSPAGELVLVASGDGRDGSLTVHQDVDVHRARLASGDRVAHEPAPGRYLWVQVISGSVQVAGRRLQEGDGLALENAGRVDLAGVGECDLLLFDLA